MSNAANFEGGPTVLPRGCGGFSPHSYGQAASSALSCHEPKDPKYTTKQTTQNERKNMNNTTIYKT